MRRNNMPRAQGGPLRTDHIQLHDLDLELELLKRKRELIEKQQQQIMGGRQSFGQSRFDYDNQPFQGLQQFNANPLFSRYDAPQPSSYGGGGLLGKRPFNDRSQWQDHSTPKRFPAPQGGPKRKFNPAPSPKMNLPKPEPLLQGLQGQNRSYNPFRFPEWTRPQPPKGQKSNFPSQRFNNQKNLKPNKDFRPNKITKPKQSGAPNKLASVPTPERAKLVKQATQSTNSSPKNHNNQDPNFILREDVVPSQQLAGRLELALGHILKEIKTKYGNTEPHIISFQSVHLQRQMKQAIRERLRSVMMGKFVGKTAAIVDSYRKVFPIETDSEIVQCALDAQKSAEGRKLAIRLENTGNAYKYIKHNLNRLVGVTLDEMFEKLQHLYENESESTKDICKQILAEGVPKSFILDSSVSSESQNVDKTESDVKTEDENAETEEKPEEETADTKAEGETVEQNANESESDNKVQDEAEKPDEAANADAQNNEEEKPVEVYDEAAAKLDSLILSLMKHRLPYMLHRYKNIFIKVLNVCGSYQVTKDAILEKAREKQKIDKRVADAEKSFKENVSASSATPSRVNSALYMVKILGRPVLPNRNLMQEFLNAYKPSSVKKHRSMHLLFVAFENKEDFDKLVALKETTVGKSTIFIKVNERMTAAPKVEESPNTTTTLNESSDSVAISTDLDEQITDLLSSIRKEEESKTDEGTNAQSGADVKVNGNEKADGTAAENGDATADPNAEPEVETIDLDNDVEKVELNEAKDKVEELKNDTKESGRATPTRASSRLAPATPSSIRTRRASRLANN